jgi:hypothetical protein
MILADRLRAALGPPLPDRLTGDADWRKDGPVAGAAVLIAAGLLMARHAVRDHTFPPYVAGTDHTIITAYSGPWLAGAIGIGAVAGLLLVVAVTDLWRRGRIRADPGTSARSDGR